MSSSSNVRLYMSSTEDESKETTTTTPVAPTTGTFYDDEVWSFSWYSSFSLYKMNAKNASRVDI